MKKIILFAILFVLQVASSSLYAEEMKGMDMGSSGKAMAVTLAGTLVDASCYVEDGATNNDHDGMKACGTECLKGGSPAGLLVGKKLYTLAFPSPVFKDVVGQRLEIIGKLYLGYQLIPVKVFVDRNGKKEEINIKGKSMM